MKQQLDNSDFNLLWTWHDGRADQAQSLYVEKMLAQDVRWEAALKQIQTLEAAMDAMPTPACPADLSERIILAARAQKLQPRRRLVRLVLGATTAAAAVILAAVGLNVLRPMEQTGQNIPVAGIGSQDHQPVDLSANEDAAIAAADELAVEIADDTETEAMGDAGVEHSAPGSLARQWWLRARLERIMQEDSLVTSLDTPPHRWEYLPQHENYRREGLAFMDNTPQEQQRLIRLYEQLISASPEKLEAYRKQAGWLAAVVDSLSQQQRDELQQMPPHQRAQRLIQRRDQLIAEGKLPEPATQPASE